ncbi:sensor histidine kinase [Geodermatophilus marinus]|uniref:sensor histidine kinase n=1 Tax=Geodermatophilus sp. LHW52908 TaxID=2303986 RepID=UPI000E3E33B0|nr:histidine kinase [Geodermatophilus sp. LHW52908]RFU20078.1 sensor histidine kinase [Geodermatophilus sp. LHW52908]
MDARSQRWATAESSRRRFRTLNLTLFLPLLSAVGAVLVARQAQTWQQAGVLGLGLVAALVAFERWTAGDIARVAVPCLAVAGAVWPYGVLALDGGWAAAYYPVALAGSLVVSHLPRHRAAAAGGLVAYVAAVGVLGFLTGSAGGADDLIDLVLFPAGFTAVVTGLMFPNKRFYDVVADMEAEHDREAELAVTRERMRFAGDLHDIQGHTLHVVKLKVALAQRLLRSEPERAEQELREIHALVGDTIEQTRELAYGRRKLNITAELENAKNLLEAAGIRVRVTCDAAAARADELLAQVLRETTTNILRHSRATLVRISLSADSLTVLNDGVDGQGPPEERGLADLGRRLAAGGGALTVERADGWFRTAATSPAAPAPGDRVAAGEAGR